MKICAVICEFNPFHKGHEYILQSLRDSGATHIVCIMSGNFTQRAYPAIFPKEARAEAALKCGADLVLELPLVYAVDTADKFAFGGASVAKALGNIDALGFGCEDEDIESLKNIAHILSSEEFSLCLKDFLKEGISFAAAREKALNTFSSEYGTMLSSPNNILAVEYIKHLKDSGMEFIPIKRMGADHHSKELSGITASGSAIRENWGKSEIESQIPREAFEVFSRFEKEGKIFCDENKFNLSVMSYLRRLSPDDIKRLPNVSEGLEYKFYKALQSSVSLEEIYNRTKSKRYSHSRIRRIALSGFLGIEKGLSSNPVPYIRVLGTNKKGLEILKEAKSTAKVPVSHSLKKLSEVNSLCEKFARLEALSTDQYNLITKSPEVCGKDYTNKFIKI